MGVIINTAYRVQADLLESESNIKIENGTLHVFDNELKVHLNNEIKNIPTSKYKVYTALLTQTGGDDIQAINWDDDPNTLTIGVTYTITSNDDNSNFIPNGAPNNNVGTSFVATSSVVAWGTGNIGDNQVSYNTGAPVVTVLENTIGNIWWTYTDIGNYIFNSDGLFNENKILSFVTPNYFNDYNIIGVMYSDINSGQITTINISNLTQPSNGLLYKTPIEIRVYN